MVLFGRKMQVRRKQFVIYQILSVKQGRDENRDEDHSFLSCDAFEPDYDF